MPPSLAAALDLAVLERRDDGRFDLLGAAPAWLEGTLAETDGALDPAGTFAALGPFLNDAERAWADRGAMVASGTFVEADASGRARPLYARAVCVDGRALLLLGPPTHSYQQTRALLQTAREEALGAARLQRRIEEREVLLHCIVHDLSNPLQNLRSSLHLLGEADIAPDERREMLALAERQTDRMQTMTREILAVFRDEVDALMPLASGASTSLRDAVHLAADAVASRAASADVHIEMDLPAASVPVVGEATRLARVVGNLLDNALRHSPSGGAVRLSVETGTRTATLVVEDDGPGVPASDVPELFRRLRQGTGAGSVPGSVGLGLYFCRIVAESWGGEVGYGPAESGGARFWVRLPLARH